MKYILFLDENLDYTTISFIRIEFILPHNNIFIINI